MARVCISGGKDGLSGCQDARGEGARGYIKRPEPQAVGPLGSLCFAAEWWKPRLPSRTDKR